LQTAETSLLQSHAEEVDFHIDEPAESIGAGVGAPLGGEDLDPYRLRPFGCGHGSGREPRHRKNDADGDHGGGQD
jgi:hypothetical protein